jgi:general secretion pathway protein L
VWGNAPPELTGLGLEIQTQARPGAPLELFAQGYQGAAHLDLLQGPYSPRTHLHKWLRPWRAAAILAGLCLGLHVAQQLTEYGQLRQEHAALRVAMEALYREAVPSARKIVNPRVQMQTRLEELRGDRHGAQAPFLELLFKGGGALRSFTNINLRGLSYSTNQLELNLEGGSLEDLDQLQQRLAGQRDLEAQIRTTKREGQVESLVTLRNSDS